MKTYHADPNDHDAVAAALLEKYRDQNRNTGNSYDIEVKCTRCRHQCMESQWVNKPSKTPGMTHKVCPKCGCQSYYDMRPQVAWCWASGLIEIGDAMPDGKGMADGCGAILIASGPKSGLKVVLSVLARHGMGASHGKLLVPGVPEAGGQREAGDALIAWLAQCAKGNGHKGRYGVEFRSAA